MCGSEQATRAQGNAQQRGHSATSPESGDIVVLSEEWNSFLHGFSQQHEGWRVSIFVISGNETSLKMNNARLERVTTNEREGSRQICIEVVRDDGSRLVYQVENPISLTFKRNLAGAHEGLDITSADGSVTILRFRVPTHPDTLDGVLTAIHNDQAKKS
jgi:hypothetical protein